jgi:hypothetical protein
VHGVLAKEDFLGPSNPQDEYTHASRTSGTIRPRALPSSPSFTPPAGILTVLSQYATSSLPYSHLNHTSLRHFSSDLQADYGLLVPLRTSAAELNPVQYGHSQTREFPQIALRLFFLVIALFWIAAIIWVP